MSSTVTLSAYPHPVLSYGAIGLCARYAVSGTDVAYGGTREYGGGVEPACFDPCPSGSALVYAATALYALAMRCPVLT
eukprot:3484207-Rhodomonas_salina.1